MMESEETGFSDDQGWLIDATINRYKKFCFDSSRQATSFMSKAAGTESSKEIRVEIMPNILKNFVEIMIIYNPTLENKVRVLMEDIEKKYNNAFTE